jgi:RNA polymerase sigma-70 factor (ECF subfamily)
MISSQARGAWTELDSRLRPYVTRRLASAADVDDVLQEIFVRIHRGLASLSDAERFGGWVYRIAQHVIVDFARRRARDPFARVTDELDAPADGAHGGAELEADLEQCVALFVARLPCSYRDAVTLTELQGLTQKDTAELLGISDSALKSRVQRGRARLRAMFEECCKISVDCRGRVIECEPRALGRCS